jgi:hypothetical protein
MQVILVIRRMLLFMVILMENLNLLLIILLMVMFELLLNQNMIHYQVKLPKFFIINEIFVKKILKMIYMVIENILILKQKNPNKHFFSLYLSHF